MFESAAEKITDRLCSREIIPEEDKSLYVYGFNMGLTIILNLISTVIVGAVSGMVFESIAFLAGYIPLRSYAGGYHASTPWRCYFISIVIICAVLAAFILIPFSVTIYGALLAAGSIVCFMLSPVEDKNKPLDEKECYVFRQRSIAVLLIEICVWITLVLLIGRFRQIIPAAVFTEAVMLVLGKLKNNS